MAKYKLLQSRHTEPPRLTLPPGAHTYVTGRVSSVSASTLLLFMAFSMGERIARVGLWRTHTLSAEDSKKTSLPCDQSSCHTQSACARSAPQSPVRAIRRRPGAPTKRSVEDCRRQWPLTRVRTWFRAYLSHRVLVPNSPQVCECEFSI